MLADEEDGVTGDPVLTSGLPQAMQNRCPSSLCALQMGQIMEAPFRTNRHTTYYRAYEGRDVRGRERISRTTLVAGNHYGAGRPGPVAQQFTETAPARLWRGAARATIVSEIVSKAMGEEAMAERELPSSYMYQDLHVQVGLSNQDLAAILLSPRPIYQGRSPRDRVTERSFLSREIVHMQPDRVNPALFADFSESARHLTSMMVSRRGGGDEAVAAIVAHYAGEAGEGMADVLSQHGRDGQLYLNCMRRLSSVGMKKEVTRASLLLLLFVAAGCLGDSRQAVGVTNQYLQRQLAIDLGTLEAGRQDTRAASARAAVDAPHLGLARLVDGVISLPIHELPADGEETVIGLLVTDGRGITDVGEDVSRRHLAVWARDGRWYCRGLGSKNGSYLISGDDKRRVVIEEPQVRRGGAEGNPVEVRAGDIVCLGATTQFLALQVR